MQDCGVNQILEEIRKIGPQRANFVVGLEIFLVMMGDSGKFSLAVQLSIVRFRAHFEPSQVVSKMAEVKVFVTPSIEVC